MRAINHALTGAVIGVVSGNPWIALPVAVASHFVVDAIPHHGNGDEVSGSQLFAVSLVVDALFCFGLVVLLAMWQPANWQLAAFCAFLATSPDFMWVGRFVRARRKLKPKRLNVVMRFHSQVQWFQQPIGAVIEVVWFFAMSFVLYAVGH